MVHNGIEYGIMAAYAEGLNVLHKADVGRKQEADVSAEITPLRDPEYYRYDIPFPTWPRSGAAAQSSPPGSST